MKYTAYFTDLTHTGSGMNSRGFPLGIGIVLAYAIKELGGLFDYRLFKLPEDLSGTLEDEIPDLLCMSNFCWNKNLSYAYAEYVKRRNPRAIVIFGGPNFPTVPRGREAFLRNHPAIDFYIKWEGELAFAHLLGKLVGLGMNAGQFKRDRTVSENCCYLVGEEYIEGPDHRVRDYDALPSPYTTGVLDEFFDDVFNPILETTRGCPYGCTFCNSGHLFKSKVVRKSQDYLAEELEYISARVSKKAELWICDDNYGMYKEDLDTSRLIRSMIEKYSWPNIVMASNGKSHPERVLESREIINEQKKGVLRFGSSLQSTDPDVLQMIKRKNLPLEGLLQLGDSKKGVNDNITDLFTELILPLPGDALEKHYHSLQHSIDVMGVTNIDIHQLNLLHGAAMADLDDRQRYQFDVRYRVYVGCFGLYELGGDGVPCAELDEVVVGCDTLPFEDYIECRIMDLLVKVFVDHDPFREVFGLLRKLDLSVFECLRLMKEKYLVQFDTLSGVIDDFVKDTKKPLFGSREEIMAFIASEGNIEKYISGELGSNELLNNKAQIFLNHRDDLHALLKESMLGYLAEKNRLTEDVREFVEQAVEFSQLRKFDFNNTQDVKHGHFSFDFIEAGKLGYEVDPRDLRIDQVTYDFFHDQETLDFAHARLGFWGKNTLSSVGKILQKTNMELMSRKVGIAPIKAEGIIKAEVAIGERF